MVAYVSAFWTGFCWDFSIFYALYITEVLQESRYVKVFIYVYICILLLRHIKTYIPHLHVSIDVDTNLPHRMMCQMKITKWQR